MFCPRSILLRELIFGTFGARKCELVGFEAATCLC